MPGLVHSKPPSRIASMFDDIAARYDLLNHVLSGGLDVYWRRRALRSVALTGREVLLDVCTGTADVAIGARRCIPRARRVIGVDFAAAMLAHGRDKAVRASLGAAIALVRADATHLPVRGGSVDVATVAFGIRNVSDPLAACREMRRALRSGGRLAILEFAMPTGPIFGRLYAFYLWRILPRLGRALSGHRVAYQYLPDSVGVFASPAQFSATLEEAGFADVRATPLTFGTVYLYTATAP